MFSRPHKTTPTGNSVGKTVLNCLQINSCKARFNQGSREYMRVASYSKLLNMTQSNITNI